MISWFYTGQGEYPKGINVNVMKLSIIKTWVVRGEKHVEPEKAGQRNNRKKEKIMVN